MEHYWGSQTGHRSRDRRTGAESREGGKARGEGSRTRQAGGARGSAGLPAPREVDCQHAKPQLATKPQAATHSAAHFPSTHLTLGLHPPTANHAQVFAEVPAGETTG